MSGRPWVDNVCPVPHSIYSEVESEKFMVVYVIILEEHKLCAVSFRSAEDPESGAAQMQGMSSKIVVSSSVA